MKDSDLQRLLRAAAETVSDQPDEMPFGFETRVLADWRAGLTRDFVDVGAPPPPRCPPLAGGDRARERGYLPRTAPERRP